MNRHYPEEWGPSNARRLTCWTCGVDWPCQHFVPYRGNIQMTTKVMKRCLHGHKEHCADCYGPETFMSRETLALQLYANAFAKSRDPRSDEYKQGVKDAIRFRLNVDATMRCPYEVGTARADAWFHGTDEGHSIGFDYNKSWMPTP